MGTYNELERALNARETLQEKDAWLTEQLTAALHEISTVHSDRNVILYGSAFMQQQNAPASHINVTLEDVNGLMSVLHGLDCSKGLTLLLHLPGGGAAAAESVVSYLRSKFDDIDVIVPMAAMSAGTMIALSGREIFLGRHSQLGPIDPQMPAVGGRTISAQAIVDQFKSASREIRDGGSAELWAPVLQSLGPALLQEAKNAVKYSRELVTVWMAKYMFANDDEASEKATRVAKFFSDVKLHRIHGRRIGFDEAVSHEVRAVRLEDNQRLQETTLSAYHLMTLVFEKTQMLKLVWSATGTTWVKGWSGTADSKGAQGSRAGIQAGSRAPQHSASA